LPFQLLGTTSLYSARPLKGAAVLASVKGKAFGRR
jgi:hypothetical protein